MAIELMEEIKAAEVKADNTKAQAQHEGREMMKSVEEACLEHERSAQQEARELYQDALNKTKEAVEKEIASHGAEKKQTLEKMTQGAQKNIKAAARLVFERIVSDGNR